MIICSQTTEGNCALMNVNTSVSVESDLQIIENEGETKFSENSEHHETLLNGFIPDKLENKCPSLIHQTDGEAEGDSSDNGKNFGLDENGSSNKFFEDNLMSEPSKLVGGQQKNGKLEDSNNPSPEKVKEDIAMLNTALHNGELPCISETSVTTRNDYNDCVKGSSDLSISNPGINDTSGSLSSSVLTTIATNESNQRSCSDPKVDVPKTVHNMRCKPLNSQEHSRDACEDSEAKLERSLRDSVESLSSFLRLSNEAISFGDEKMLDSKASSAEVDLNSLKDFGNTGNSKSESTLVNVCHIDGLQEVCDTSELNFTTKDVIDRNIVKEPNESSLNLAMSCPSQKSSTTHQPEDTVLNESPLQCIESTTKTSEVQVSNSINCAEKHSVVLSEVDSEIHSMNIQDYANLKVECSHYKSENEQLQHQLSLLESEFNSLKTQQAQLMSTIEKQEKQLKQIDETAKRQQEVDAKSYTAFKHELELQNERLKQECEAVKHEREVSVMRYAKSEMDVIQLREKIETCQKKLQEAIKERDGAQANMKQLIADKTKYSQMYDNKCSEVRVAHNEMEQLKSDLNARNIKLKWAQNKLKEEQDSHKETQSKLDKVTSTIQAARNEAEQAKVDAQISIKTFQESQENRAYVLDQQLKEEQAKLILVRAEKEDLEKKIHHLTNKLQLVEADAKTLSEKNNRLTDQLQGIEKEKLEMEMKLSTMQQLMDKEVQENVELEAQLSELRGLRLELEQEKKKSESLESEAVKLRSSNAELLADMDSCRQREAETLEFTQRLTTQNVRLQSDFSALQAKNEELEMEQSKVNDLKVELEKEKSQRLEENKILARHVAEHSQRCEELSKQLAEQKSENVVLRRKNAATIRELTRELQQVKKQYSEHSDGGGSGSNSLCQDSRASSCASLTDTSQALSSTPGSIHVEPDKQTLIERIVELQRRNALYLERIDFLEEHNQEMTEELKKKTKIVQNFMLREPVGALSSNSMDSNKLFLSRPLQFSKEMALSKKGYMASLYSSKIKDKNMTLEKSLEICQTLHSLLEDTILKNITLKENMDTLGEEIARLRSEQIKEGES